jgi:hypothetical protein
MKRKKKKIKDTHPIELTIKFKTQDDVDQWTTWYINSGEQHSNYYTDLKKSIHEGEDQVLTVAANEDEQCPECRYVGDYDGNSCGNCNFEKEENQEAKRS